MHYTKILGRPAAQLPASWASLLRVARGTAAVALIVTVMPSVQACAEDLEAQSGLDGAFPSPETATQAARDALEAGDRESAASHLRAARRAISPSMSARMSSSPVSSETWEGKVNGLWQ